MSALPFETFDDTRAQLGLVVLQADETIEDELRQILPKTVSLNVTRIPSSPEVTRDTLDQMRHHLSAAAGLFPNTKAYDVVGYGCTSGTAQIGATQIAELVCAGTRTQQVTEPVSALIAACRAQNIRRLAFLSPYVESVSTHLRKTLADAGVETPVFGSFEEADETVVAHINAASVESAARTLVQDQKVDALFMSCTNLKTFEVIPTLARDLAMPVWSSNLVLGWHMLHLAGAVPPVTTASALL